ncbi:hypothetical protein LUZ60_003660 [Juncus effusus]|nr:hypothetical protein LUZ60_003660 [Juncus effusus]
MDQSHKLCGFLRTLLSPSSNNPTISISSTTGVPLFPIQTKEDEPTTPNSNSNLELTPKSGNNRRKSLALAKWGASVIEQLSVLVAHKLVQIEARVLRVYGREIEGVEETRALVLIDVYLPSEAWSGWQFPKWCAVAASLFKHVSCDWKLRNSLISFDWSSNEPHESDNQIWRLSTCHVLSCKTHQIQTTSNKKPFDLHEIFKSLPCLEKDQKLNSTQIKPADPFESETESLGIWNISDDILNNILTLLSPRDLIRIAATCHHLRALAASIMPCMKLKLFPHQEAAVEWMLKRESQQKPNSQTRVLPHPLYREFRTEDNFFFHMNVVSGEIRASEAPVVHDFLGGLFCDEPGLGKTITALSLILKTHGTLPDPPFGARLTWCMNQKDKKCAYYEVFGDESRKRGKVGLRDGLAGTSFQSVPVMRVCCKKSKSMSGVKRNVKKKYEDDSDYEIERKKRRKTTSGTETGTSTGTITSHSSSDETWIQCDSCKKWRKLNDKNALDTTSAWFCTMNSDPLRQSCTSPEESWDQNGKVTSLPGFFAKDTEQPCKEENVSFFTNVLRDHYSSDFNSETKKALNWLANLSPQKLLELESTGLTRPAVLDAKSGTGSNHPYHKIFQNFGLIKKVERRTTKWYYPSMLDKNLSFDSTALRVSLTRPLDSHRLYLSSATLIVVPANLVDHWKTQIERHVLPGQLRVCSFGSNTKNPSAPNLAWDYDIVITTFSRLSSEWGPRKKSVLSQIHWYRIMLDEGHTLGSSLTLTNKFQMAVSLQASSRWILTGTPTPNTPSSQVAHLQPMLRFLKEEVYGLSQESWELGIEKLFEGNCEEGRVRVLELLKRVMISARKDDLANIPKCLKKVVYVNFNEEHAKSYNELVSTVRRNILTADWNDPSHVESLLNPKQWKFRGNTIKNLRLSCCVAGHIKMTEAGQDIQETMDVLVGNGLDPESEEYCYIRIALLNGCSCVRCKDWCRLPVITPCKHLLCLDCVALDSEKCTVPGCGNRYEMQSPETLARPENPNPKWPVPKDLIELQPSYEQEDWAPDWQSTISSKVAYLAEKLKDLKEVNKRMGYCMEMNSAIEAQDNKTFAELPEKVIIFSQFLEHIHVIEQQLSFAGITFVGMYNPIPSNHKMKSLMKFKNNPNCMALIMDGSAALGLDLSFVTHVFLMEPIWDRSVEEQVISRAHRMGATRPIHVETLAMRGTIEEQMLEFLQDPNARIRLLKQEIVKGENEPIRAHKTLHDFAESNYLARLSFVRTRPNS